MPWPMQAAHNLDRPPALASLVADGPVALFLDFDGTLVPIASTPDTIEVPDTLGDRLRALAARLNGALAVVSGRSIDDLARYFGSAGMHIAGSHGGHLVDPGGNALLAPARFSEAADRELQDFANEHDLLYEPKSHGAALHYRAKPSMEAATRTFAHALASAHGLDCKLGKCVVELMQPGANKGRAVTVLAAREPFSGCRPVFVGDDITDEDGFTACEELGGFGIQVSGRSPTAARYRLDDVEDVIAWLDL